jgi:peptidoglycan/LPS O-acetylase OafA/YrhL
MSNTAVTASDAQETIPHESAVVTSGSKVNLEYRADVDGLRAIAVLSVLLFHSFPSLMPGGFVGVDIFFVISGFLITGIILRGLQEDKFTYAEFYARRIGRIFPSLSLVLVVCWAIGWCVLFPDEYRQLAKHTIAGAMFMSNLLLWHQAGYFDAAAHSKPLLHLWSLGIEEQFYIVWPLFLVVCWRRSKKLPVFIAFIAFMSFLLNVWLISKWPSLTFYLPITRIWELLIGSLLAWFMTEKNGIRSRLANELLAVVGILLIVVSLFLAKEGGSFPGWFAVLPTVGTAMGIAAGPRAWMNRSFLSLPFVVLTGLISYPLYLWHWPLLVYLKLIVDSDVVVSRTLLCVLKVAVLVASFGLAWATWYFWERPLRRSSHVARSRTVKTLVAMMCLITCAAALALTNVVRARLDNPFINGIVKAVDDWDYSSGDNFMTSAFVLHEVHSHSTQETLFVGDSHMEQYWPRAKTVIKNNPRLSSAIFATSSGCPPFPNLNRAKPGFACPQFYKYWAVAAARQDVRTVVIGAAWEFYFLGEYPGGTVPALPLSVDGRPATPEDVEMAWKGLEATVASLVRSGKRVVILSSSPATNKFNPHGMMRRFGGWEGSRLLSIDENKFSHYIAPVEQRLRWVSAQTGATVLYPIDYFCDVGVCSATEGDGSPIYRDDQHLRSVSAIKRATFIDTMLEP